MKIREGKTREEEGGRDEEMTCSVGFKGGYSMRRDRSWSQRKKISLRQVLDLTKSVSGKITKAERVQETETIIRVR